MSTIAHHRLDKLFDCIISLGRAGSNARYPWPGGPSNPSNLSGCVSNRRTSAGNTTHGCALRVQKCTVCRSRDVSSSVPARIERKPVGERSPNFTPPYTRVPHEGQNHPVIRRPRSDSRLAGFNQGPVRWNRCHPSASIPKTPNSSRVGSPCNGRHTRGVLPERPRSAPRRTGSRPIAGASVSRPHPEFRLPRRPQRPRQIREIA